MESARAPFFDELGEFDNLKTLTCERPYESELLFGFDVFGPPFSAARSGRKEARIKRTRVRIKLIHFAASVQTGDG